MSNLAKFYVVTMRRPGGYSDGDYFTYSGFVSTLDKASRLADEATAMTIVESLADLFPDAETNQVKEKKSGRAINAVLCSEKITVTRVDGE